MEEKLSRLGAALKDLLDCPDLNLDELEGETRHAIETAGEALREAASMTDSEARNALQPDEACPSSRSGSEEPAMKFQVTQRIYGFRRYLVEAMNWEEAKRKVENTAPPNTEADLGTELTQVVTELDFPTVAFQGAVAFVESEDGAEVFFERG